MSSDNKKELFLISNFFCFVLVSSLFLLKIVSKQTTKSFCALFLFALTDKWIE